MGTPDNVLIDKNVTSHAANEYLALSEEEVTALGQLYEIDGEMMNYWFGEGGEAFTDMANIIEKEFNNLNIFSEDVHEALDSTGTNFVEQDQDVSDSLEVETLGKAGVVA